MQVIRAIYSTVLFFLCTSLVFMMAVVKPNMPIDHVVMLLIPILSGYYGAYIIFELCFLNKDEIKQEAEQLRAIKEETRITKDLTSYWQLVQQDWLSKQKN